MYLLWGVGLRLGAWPRLHVARKGLWVQRIRLRTSAGSLGPKWVGETLAHSLPILLTPEGLPPFLLISWPWMGPSKGGNPSSPPAAPQCHWSHLASSSPSPFLSPRPTQSLKVFSHSVKCPRSPNSTGSCPSCEETWTPSPPTPPSWLCPKIIYF